MRTAWRALSALPLCLLVAATSLPEERSGDGPASTAKPKDEAASPRVLTRHGDVLVGKLGIRSVSVRTSYGILELPIEDVSRIQFAPRLTAGEEQEIASILEALRTGGHGRGLWEAKRDLRRFGLGALKVLRRIPAGEDAAFRELVDGLVEDLRGAFGQGNIDDDVVVSKRFSLLGEVSLASLGIETPYGPLVLERTDLAHLVLAGGASPAGTNRVLIIKSWTDTNEEYVRVQAIVSERTRLRLVEFTGTTGSDLARALHGHRVLLVPELEGGGASSDEAAEAAGSALRRFVKEGGVVVCCGGSANFTFLSRSGLVACSGGSQSGGAAVARSHPILRGVSGEIPQANATFPLQVSGGKMQTLAKGSAGGIVVGLARIGEGAVVYCGWDFYQSEESHQRILANAVRWAANPTVEPAGRR